MVWVRTSFHPERLQRRDEEEACGVREEDAVRIEDPLRLLEGEERDDQLRGEDADGLGGEGPHEALEVNQRHENREAERVVHACGALQGLEGDRDRTGGFLLGVAVRRDEL